MMTENDWYALIERFAPQVRLSRTSPFKDPFSPSTIDWYLARSSMRDREDPIFFIEHPSRADLAANPQESRFLMPDGESVRAGDRATAAMYVHVRNATDPAGIADKGWLDIQYWFFYPYNGKIGGPVPLPLGGAHEGDWEHITVRVSNWRTLGESAIEGVFFAAHGHREGRWLTQAASKPRSDAYAVVDGTHVIAYSAWHSHASYEDDGVQLRPITWYFANDICSGGFEWGPLKRERLEIMSIDEDVYAPDDQQIADTEWLPFTGKWGSDGSPRGPACQGPYTSDGVRGFAVEADVVATYGDGWGSKRGTTAVALGRMDGQAVLAVGRNQGDNSRFVLYGSKDDALVQIAEGGDSWGSSRSATGVAIGPFGGTQALVVGRSSGDNTRFQIYRLEDGELKSIASGGDGWGKSRGCSGVAVGLMNNEPVVGVGRTKGDNQRFEIYRWKNNALERMAAGGNSWGNSRGCTAIAFGVFGELQLVGVGRSSGSGSRFKIYRWKDGALELFASGGDGWGSSRETTAIAFGALGGRPVVGVTRNAGDNARFRIYSLDGKKMELLVEGGDGWGSSRGGTGIAFGVMDGREIVAVSRTQGDNSKVYLYTMSEGELVNVGVTGSSWGGSRAATGVAIGRMGGHDVAAYGRSAGDNTRGGLIAPI